MMGDKTIGRVPDEYYFDKGMQEDFEKGKEDGLGGKMNSGRANWRVAYMSGWDIGFDFRMARILKDRIANLKKARKSKIKKEGKNGK
jgi:hypothetical protein